MSKSKKLKVGKDDVRVGNFIYHVEDDFIKVSDVSGMVSHRISTLCVKGQQMLMACQGVNDNPRYKVWLEQYAVVTFNVLSCIFDVEYLSAINTAAMDCIERHKDMYVKNVSEEDDERILGEVKESQEAVEEMKKSMEEE